MEIKSSNDPLLGESWLTVYVYEFNFDICYIFLSHSNFSNFVKTNIPHNRIHRTDPNPLIIRDHAVSFLMISKGTCENKNGKEDTKYRPHKKPFIKLITNSNNISKKTFSLKRFN